ALALEDRRAADVDAREQRAGVVAPLVQPLELAVRGLEVPRVRLLARERAERVERDRVRRPDLERDDDALRGAARIAGHPRHDAALAVEVAARRRIAVARRLLR